MTEIQHDAATRRFVASIDDHQAELEYELEGRGMVITHTRVPEAISGRGVAGELTRTAFEHARKRSLEVVPQCPYAAAWVQRHPEYAPLMR
jgi:uncharacterized protein